MKGFNTGYKYNVEFYEYGMKPWPLTMEEAYLAMAKVTSRKPAGSGQPNSTHVLAVKTAGQDKGEGKPSGGAGSGGAGKKGGCMTYGTQPGNYNTCKEPGHYSYGHGKLSGCISSQWKFGKLSKIHYSSPVHSPTPTSVHTPAPLHTHRSHMLD